MVDKKASLREIQRIVNTWQMVGPRVLKRIVGVFSKGQNTECCRGKEVRGRAVGENSCSPWRRTSRRARGNGEGESGLRLFSMFQRKSEADDGIDIHNAVMAFCLESYVNVPTSRDRGLAHDRSFLADADRCNVLGFLARMHRGRALALHLRASKPSVAGR